ncbi:GYD domain-containing protein [Halomarina pelagica]|uniref:GYD domain-containing protein n=1 Tax=Halomarina pelagica TaxID=2961599 RepID=UPI0020C50109|nr:GYD domain-containing protein [Halomarina sp. BND7]
MNTYMALVDVRETIQNVQELASVWGEIRNEIHDLDGTLTDAYAVLGEHDYLLLFEAPNRDRALQISLVVERRGLDMQTMELIPVDRFGELVDDI